MQESRSFAALRMTTIILACGRAKCFTSADCRSLQHKNILAGANVLQNLRPDAHSYLTQMRLAQQQHEGACLSHATADAQRNLAVDDGLVVREFQKFRLPGHTELLAQ